MDKKIITVTLNPCIDRTMEFERVASGGLNRADFVRVDYGGKGVNVAKVLNALGYKTVCAGLLNKTGGTDYKKFLDAECIAHDFIELDGNLRTNVKVYDKSERTMTEFNERGVFTAPEAIGPLLDKLFGYKNDAIFVLSGSLPAGMPEGIYKQIIETLYGTPVVLDADGAALKSGLAAGPFMIKPNLYELGSIFGVELKNRADAVLYGKRVADEFGVKIVLVSMGGDGAAITDGKDVFYAEAPDVEIRGLQGAGDAMVAGACAAHLNGKNLGETLRYAVAAAAGSIKREGTLLCTADGFADAYARVKTTAISS